MLLIIYVYNFFIDAMTNIKDTYVDFKIFSDKS